MRKKFISKNYRQYSFLIKTFLILILVIFILSKIMSIRLFNSNKNLIMMTMESSNHLIKTELSYSDILEDILKIVTNIDLKKPISLFNNNLLFESIKEIIGEKVSDEEILDESNTDLVFNEQSNLPLVYIYNTHQTEEYINNESTYDLKPTVYTAANYLKEVLERQGIKTIVEEANIKKYLDDNNLNYDDSYIASRYYLEQAKNNNPSLKLFIDLHRDALSHDAATVIYNNISYAKILFVVGADFNNYQKNLNFTESINKIVIDNYSFLTRGVLTKTGPLVNGVYNQDLGDNIILLEVGGNESTINEVANTLDLIGNVIVKKLGEENG